MSSEKQVQPYQWPSRLFEYGFCIALCMTQFLAEYLISGFALQLPLISEQQQSIGSDSQTSALWPASLLSLVMSAMLLICARLSDMFGGYWLFLLGTVWLSIWTFVPGFTRAMVVLNCARAMQGLALACFMPSTFAILGKLYASGRRKNAIIAIYSGFAPLGFFGGFIVAGSLPVGASQWYFHIGGILAGVTALVAWATIPRSVTLRRNTEVEMDWLGSFLIVTGLILLCYSLAVEPYADKNSNAAGFAQAIVLGPFIAGLACLVAAFYVEGWFAKCPLVPLDFFSPPSVKSFSLAAMCFYAGFGVWLYYSVDYFQAPAVTSDDLATHQTQLAIWYLPMGIVGLICCVAGEPILHSMPMTLLLFLVGLAWVAAPLILAAVPTPIGYWSTVFPSMLSATAGINFTFTISIVFLSSVQPPSYQGLCGAICSILLGLAFAFSLPIAQIVMTQVSGSNWIMDSSAPLGSSEEADMLLGYRSAFIYATASAGVGLAACVLFVRIPTPGRMGEKRRESRSTDGEAGGE